MATPCVTSKGTAAAKARSAAGHEADDVPQVHDRAVEQRRQEAVGVEHRRSVKPTAIGQYPGHIADQAPRIHLPRRPRSLPEEEVRRQRRERAHQKAAAPTEHGPREDADGRHRLEVGKGREQDASRSGERGKHRRGHDLAKDGLRGLEAGEEHAHGSQRHDDREQRPLLRLEARARAQCKRHGDERRHLERAEDPGRLARGTPRHDKGSSCQRRAKASTAGR